MLAFTGLDRQTQCGMGYPTNAQLVVKEALGH